MWIVKLHFAVFLLLLIGCSSQPMYIEKENLPRDATAKIVVLLDQEDLGLQVFSAGSSGMGAFGQMLSDFKLSSDKKSSDANLAKLKNSINFSSDLFPLDSSNFELISWVKTIEIEECNDSSKFNVEKELDKLNGTILIVVEPRYYLSPHMDMVETRSNIYFYLKEKKPFYSTVSVTQSKIIEIPNLEKPNWYYGAAFLGPSDKDLVLAIDYWGGENGDLLRKILRDEISEAARLIGIAIEEAGNPNESDRKYSKIQHDNLEGNYGSFKLDGFYMEKYSTDSRDVLRKLSQPYQYPAHAYNAIFSIPKNQNLQNINNRH